MTAPAAASASSSPTRPSRCGPCAATRPTRCAERLACGSRAAIRALWRHRVFDFDDNPTLAPADTLVAVIGDKVAGHAWLPLPHEPGRHRGADARHRPPSRSRPNSPARGLPGLMVAPTGRCGGACEALSML